MEKEKILETLLSVFKETPKKETNCFYAIDTEKMQNVNCLVYGSGKTSLEIANKLQSIHHFYVSYRIDMDVWRTPNEACHQQLSRNLQDIRLIGRTLFVGHFDYLKTLQQTKPDLADKFLFYTPNMEEDYIKKMVDLAGDKAQNLSDFKALRQASLYKTIARQFNVLVVPCVSLDNFVYASYIYHDIKQSYKKAPKLYVLEFDGGSINYQIVHGLLNGLGVNNEDICEVSAFNPAINETQNQLIEKMKEVLLHQRAIWVCPKRWSKTMYDVGAFLVGSFCCMGAHLYVWSEDIIQLMFRQDIVAEELIKNAIACLQSSNIDEKEEKLAFLQEVSSQPEMSIQKNAQIFIKTEEALRLKASLLQKMHENNIKQLFYQ